MSDYTISLKRCLEVYGTNEIISWFMDYDERNYLSLNELERILNKNIYGNSVFNKKLLAVMIIEHYYFREIAYETPEMFRHYVKVKLQEIMRKISSTYLFSFFKI